MKEYRCSNCLKLLFKGTFNTIEIKCPRCKRIILISNATEHPTEKHCGKREKITHSDKTLHH
ncbi:Com family DNA-binding transcriptional regulator [Citrobacter koseri]|uniref:Com family DNA-binding transcriptional regulator n=1 Tax=Citrobacter koseri TaxID=545 RepID=UPI0029477203|nr:Com family DNA-binding transcriptional regulator [Citrobacter koseri]HED1844333.1 Com family DNA-binding transcriptional regulator [Citrobacter koseri]